MPMSRRKQVLYTYGRHRKRVVSVDLWSTEEKSGQKEDLFASLSNDSSITKSFDVSLDKPRCKRASFSSQSSSSDGSIGLFNYRAKQALETNERPKRAAARKNRGILNKENTPKELAINFSEIDNYSLVMSDATSPVSVERRLSDSLQQTSTPHITMACKKLTNTIASIPDIESDNSYYTPNESRSVLECSAQLNELNLSSIAESETSLAPHASFEASCDMFETLDQASLESVARRSTSLREQDSRSLNAQETSLVNSEEYEGYPEAISLSIPSHCSLLSDIPEEVNFSKPRQHLLDLDELRSSCPSMMHCLSPVKHRVSGCLISPQEKVLLQCDQDDVIPFKKCLTPTMLKKCCKIGEGVYAEVFKTERRRESVALKVIPIEGNFLVNDEQQKTYEEILSEIIISKELSTLHDGSEFCTLNFVRVKRVSLVRGPYPQQLLDEWEAYAQRKNSENDNPDIFPVDQLFIVFEFENCGEALETFEFKSAEQTLSVISQVTAALAVAENVLQFEHRDLHIGNVLIRSVRQKQLMYCLNGEEFFIQTQGIKVSIIDFTLSRLAKDGCSIYTDLASDNTLFEGQGDYQFDIYRMMKAYNKNLWKAYEPYTNVLWIHYLIDKMLTQKSKEFTPSQTLTQILNTVCEYRSAGHLLPFTLD